MKEINVYSIRKEKQLHNHRMAIVVRIKEVYMRNIKIFGLFVGLCLLVTLPVAAEANRHGRGRITVAPVVRPYGWLGSFGYYGVYEPYGFYQPFSMYNRNTGEIKLKANVKNAEVYINGAFAGTTDKLKSIRLKADAYSLELRALGHVSFTQRIFVIAGKTVHVHVNLPAEAHP